MAKKNCIYVLFCTIPNTGINTSILVECLKIYRIPVLQSLPLMYESLAIPHLYKF